MGLKDDSGVCNAAQHVPAIEDVTAGELEGDQESLVILPAIESSQQGQGQDPWKVTIWEYITIQYFIQEPQVRTCQIQGRWGGRVYVLLH